MQWQIRIAAILAGTMGLVAGVAAENRGLSPIIPSIEQMTQHCSPEKAMEMFESGAAAGYLNPDCYDSALPDGFIDTARKLIAHDFQAQANADRQVELTFFRIYLLAQKL